MPGLCLLLGICANREAGNTKGCNFQLMNLQPTICRNYDMVHWETEVP